MLEAKLKKLIKVLNKARAEKDFETIQKVTHLLATQLPKIDQSKHIDVIQVLKCAYELAHDTVSAEAKQVSQQMGLLNQNKTRKRAYAKMQIATQQQIGIHKPSTIQRGSL